MAADSRTPFKLEEHGRVVVTIQGSNWLNSDFTRAGDDMAFSDLCQFIQALDRNGEVIHIREGVNWNSEAGAINRRLYVKSSSVVLFEQKAAIHV